MKNEELNPFYTKEKKKVGFSLDYRVIILLLLAAIGVMLWLWKPWQAEVQTNRTISITGEATLKAAPDEFVFYASYQYKNADKKAALAEMSKQSEAITKKLKDIGLSDSQIKSNSNGYQNYYYTSSSETYNYSLSLTITAKNQEQAQKVQDYLVTTDVVGTVSPTANFSDAKRKELENQARDQATKDARSKADQSAGNLGFKIAGVKSVEDGSNFKNNYLLRGGGADLMLSNEGASSSSSAKLQVQPGENDLNYSVTVVYFIK